MPVYPTHTHAFIVIDEDGEECRVCGYSRWRGVVGSEYVSAQS